MAGNSPFLATLIISSHLIHCISHSPISFPIFISYDQFDRIFEITRSPISEILLRQKYFNIIATFFNFLIECLSFPKVVVLSSRMQ